MILDVMRSLNRVVYRVFAKEKLYFERDKLNKKDGLPSKVVCVAVYHKGSAIDVPASRNLTHMMRTRSFTLKTYVQHKYMQALNTFR